MNRIVLRGAAVLAALAGVLSGCAPPPPAPETPSFYSRLDEGGRLDEAVALSLVNGHRARFGLPPLAFDPALAAQARARAGGVAASDSSTWGETPKVGTPGSGAGRLERVSAGYRTLAEAFSGWRDSPQHNAVMLSARGARLGLAAVDRPGTKYRVYWAIIVEE